MTVPDRLIQAIARATIDRHGMEAAGVAAKRADQRRRLGDPEGTAAWLAIKRAIEALQAIEPGPEAPSPARRRRR
ncbi:MAG TPA: hypothetical protein VIF14_05725 [Alphaproteobacteria bacterium]|jgi:hypothetical protein